MLATLHNLLVLAQESPGPGRSENPDDGIGVLVIVGIILLVVLGGAALAFFFSRGRATRTSLTREEHEEGRVGRQG